MSATATRPQRQHPAPPVSVGSGAALVLVAGGLLALNRFGGLVTDAPRAFARLTLVVVWGWIALSTAVWLSLSAARRRPPDPRQLQAVLGAIGRAHVSLIGLALVLFVTAGALQLRWPGLVAAVAVFTWWFPVGVVAAAPTGLTRTVRIGATLPAYIAWLLVVGTHLEARLGHLL